MHACRQRKMAASFWRLRSVIKLKSHVSGAWYEGRGAPAVLLNPATEEPLAETSTAVIDFKAALDYARDVGGPALRNISFAERGACWCRPNGATVVHAREVFGPAVTVMDYRSVEDAAAICARGDGALVSSVYSNDRRFAREMLLALAPHHGRLALGGEKVAGFAPGPGATFSR